MNLGMILEMLQRFLNVHIQDIGNALPFVFHFQRFVMKPFAFTHRACHPNVGKKIHFQLVRAMSFTRFAATRRDIKTESPWLVATQF